MSNHTHIPPETKLPVQMPSAQAPPLPVPEIVWAMMDSCVMDGVHTDIYGFNGKIIKLTGGFPLS